jgi:hypothetical protein
MTKGVTNLIVQRLACHEEKRKRSKKYSAASLKFGMSGIEAAERQSKKTDECFFNSPAADAEIEYRAANKNRKLII